MSEVSDLAGVGERVDLRRRSSVNGVDLAWDRWGGGADAPLVLGHGFSGSSHDFSLQIPFLAADREVVAFDRRGHGLSTNTGDAGTYTIDQLVADDIAFLEAEVGGPVDLLGHSMGGRVAAQLTLERPDLVRSLILMDTSAWSFQTTDDDIRALLTAFFETYDPADGLPDTSRLGTDEQPLIAAAAPAAWRERKEVVSAMFDPVALRALGMALFGGTVGSLRPRLGEIVVPVTVVAGSNDHPFADQAPELAAEVADGELALIDGAYHSPQLTHATAWRAAVAAHLLRADRLANR